MRARARPGAARTGHDPATQRRTAAADERGAGTGLRGGRSRHADAAGDDHDIRCYLDTARNRAGLDRVVHLPTASFRFKVDRSPACGFPKNPRANGERTGAADFEDPLVTESRSQARNDVSFPFTNIGANSKEIPNG